MQSGDLEMRLILIGPQGSGKGTQGKLLQHEYGWLPISSGDLIRARIKNDPSFDEKYGISKGNLLPDDIITQMIKERIKEKDCEKGYILDGFPRKIKQAEVLDTMIKVDYALLIDVPDKESIKRLSARWQCKGCNKIYGLNEAPPKVCPCGGEVYQREDDKPAAIKKRLELYHKETEPILGYYEKQGKLLKVNGKGTVEEVFEKIKKVLGK